MDIWDTNKLILFLGFVIPGFVSLKTYELLFPAAYQESAKRLIDAIAYSSINYALLFWPIYEVETNQIRTSHPRLYLLFYFCVFLVAPILWVFLLKQLRYTQFFQKTFSHPENNPWDYIFGKRQCFWMIVVLKDGQKIAGKYGLNSFASSAPAPERIYLEETWVLNNDGGFDRPRVDSAGIIILAPEISTIELFNIT